MWPSITWINLPPELRALTLNTDRIQSQGPSHICYLENTTTKYLYSICIVIVLFSNFKFPKVIRYLLTIYLGAQNYSPPLCLLRFSVFAFLPLK